MQEPCFNKTDYSDSSLCYFYIKDDSRASSVYCSIERRGHKTNKYWLNLLCKRKTRGTYECGNLLDTDYIIADSPTEAKEHLVESLDRYIAKLQSIKQAIQNYEL